MSSLDPLIIAIRRLVAALEVGSMPQPPVAYSGCVDVGATASTLPDQAILRGVMLSVEGGATATAYVVGRDTQMIEEGIPLNAGDRSFFPAGNTNQITLVAAVTPYTTVRVYWWAT